MTFSISDPAMNSFFGDATVGAIYARCLLVAFIILALLYAIFHVSHMRRKLRLLDEAAEIHRINASPYDTGRAKKDVSEYRQ
jgi:hypothetical protein